MKPLLLILLLTASAFAQSPCCADINADTLPVSTGTTCRNSRYFDDGADVYFGVNAAGGYFSDGVSVIGDSGGSGNSTRIRIADAYESIRLNGRLEVDKGIEDPEETGDAVMNDGIAGYVRIFAGTSTRKVISNRAFGGSIILPVIRTDDPTCRIKNVVPEAGSFRINMTVPCMNLTSVGYFIIN